MANTKTYLKRAHSKNPLRIFTWNKDIGTVFPDFSFDAVEALVNADPVARGALNHYVDKCMEGDYNIIKRDTKKYDPDFEMLLDEKYQFRTDILRKIFLMGKKFNNSFIEIIRDIDNKSKALNVLDSRNVDPVTETNGDPIKYKSKVPDSKTGKYAEWDKKDIVWIKFGDDGNGWAPIDWRALWQNLTAKTYVTRYIAWLWQTGQYRLLYNFDNASQQDVEDFLTYAKKHDNNFKAPFITKGTLKTTILRDMKETQSFIKLLEYYDNQTLILLRIPPVDAGIVDSSGRSSADQQSNNLGTTVLSARKLVEDKINFDLLPKMNKANNLLKFAPVDRFAVKQVFENVQLMSSMGMTPEAMEEYFADCGMYWKATLFKPPEEESMEGDSDNPRDKDMMPSRIGKGEGESNKKIGTGDEGTSRPDQVGKE